LTESNGGLKRKGNTHVRNNEAYINRFFLASLILSVSPVSSARPAVVLAFDDGWTSVYYKALPIMQANNQKGVDFIITIEPPRASGRQGMQYMNLTQLNSLYSAGWDLSSHTVTHPFLTTLSTTALNSELKNSQISYPLQK
jgi:peptidoglycan/xylan/chitin deacetylase (PgdA/CDA1 family)